MEQARDAVLALMPPTRRILRVLPDSAPPDELHGRRSGSGSGRGSGVHLRAATNHPVGGRGGESPV
jgi:hypothetical protein